MVFRLLAKLFLSQGDRAIALLAQAEAATATAYYRLAIKPAFKEETVIAGTTLLYLSQQEYSHSRLLQLRLGGVDPAITARPHPADRPGWTESSCFALGLSNYWSWKVLFGGKSLFAMDSAEAIRCVAVIETVHALFYEALSQAGSPDQPLYAKIFKDERSHAEILKRCMPEAAHLALIYWVLLPLAVMAFVVLDWPRIRAYPVETALRWQPTTTTTKQ